MQALMDSLTKPNRQMQVLMDSIMKPNPRIHALVEQMTMPNDQERAAVDRIISTAGSFEDAVAGVQHLATIASSSALSADVNEATASAPTALALALLRIICAVPNKVDYKTIVLLLMLLQLLFQVLQHMHDVNQSGYLPPSNP